MGLTYFDEADVQFDSQHVKVISRVSVALVFIP